MSFKYLNPGYVPISYGFSNNTSVRTIRNTTYNPRCGVALVSATASSNVNCVLEQAITNDTNYLYIKFDIFIPANVGTSEIYTDVIVASNTIFRIYQTASTIQAVPMNNTSYGLNVGGINLGKVNTVLLQLSTSSNSWSLTAYVNDGENPIFEDLSNSSYSGTIQAQSLVRFWISNSQPISNIIVSDTEINFKAVIVAVDSSAVDTTMTARTDGTYSTAQIGNYVLKTLDTTGLYGNFGSDSAVLGMALFAAPAFTTGSDVLYLRGRTVNGTTVTDYPPPEQIFDGGEWSDYYTLKEMTEEEFQAINSSNTLALPSYELQLPVTANTTLAALNGLKVGGVSGSGFEE